MILYVKLNLFPLDSMGTEFDVVIDRHMKFNRDPDLGTNSKRDLKEDGICVIAVGKYSEEYVIDTTILKNENIFISGAGDKEKFSVIWQIIRDYNIKTLIE